MPISRRGILAQCAGRLHRLHATKRVVVIYDYADGSEPMLAKMVIEREAGYRSLGHRASSIEELDLEPSGGDSGRWPPYHPATPSQIDPLPSAEPARRTKDVAALLLTHQARYALANAPSKTGGMLASNTSE